MAISILGGNLCPNIIPGLSTTPLEKERDESSIWRDFVGTKKLALIPRRSKRKTWIADWAEMVRAVKTTWPRRG